MKAISLSFCFQIFFSVLYSQNQNKLNIPPGLYHMDDRLNSRGGELLLKPDSTLVFFGLSSIPVNPCFTAATGTWYIKADTLHMLFREYAEQELYFYNSGISYAAESKPSYDSVYINLEIQNADGTPKNTRFLLGSKSYATVKGKYSITIGANDFPKYNRILIQKSHISIPDGGFYGTQLALDPKNNVHSIKIKLHNFSEIPIMLSSISGSRWQFYPYKKQVNEELIFEYKFKLKKETNLNNLNEFMEKAIANNPTFKPFLDKINLELKSGL